MKSVMSFPERGTYGDSKWRGNTSGFVIKELIEHFNPKLFVDACEGSGTSGDVCKEMGIDYVGLDLYKGQDFTRDYILNQLPRPADVCFTHPPYHCLHPDSLVINDSGIPIPIKDYEVGDKTINQYGEIVDVVAVAKKKNTKQIKTIEIEGYSIEPLRVTSDHLCLVLEAKRCKYLSQNRFCNKDCNHLSNKTGSCFNGDAPYHNYKKIWKKAEDIADGDYILYAKPKIKKTDSKIKISDFLDNNNYSLFDDYLYYNGNKNGITKRGKECKYKLKNSIEINETFSYLSGLFISEGSTTFKADGGGTIYFSFHRDEKEYISFVEKAMYEIFEIKGKVRYVKNSKAVRLEFYSKPIAEFLSLLFGKNATLKRIPKVLVYSKENIQKNLIRGLLHGDGCLSQSSFSTTSRTLIEQIRYICFMLGFKFSVHYGNSKTTKVQIHNNKKLSNTSISYYGYLPKNAFNYFYNNIENSWRDRAIRY